VVAAEPFWFAELEIDRGGPALGIAVKGLDPQRAPNVLTIGQHMVRGKFDLLREQTQSPAILLGDVLADKLAARLGDVVTLSVPGASKKVSFQVAGMFHYDFEEYDDRLAIVALPSMQRLLDSGDDVMGVDMRLDDIAKSATVAKELGKELGDPYQVMDWYELHKHTITAVFGDWKP
jgi:lipoprotein-releasing system permease protein